MHYIICFNRKQGRRNMEREQQGACLQGLIDAYRIVSYRFFDHSFLPWICQRLLLAPMEAPSLPRLLLTTGTDGSVLSPAVFGTPAGEAPVSSVGNPPTHAGCTSSPLTEQMYIPSSSVTFLQFHPSEANSTAFRSAFSCNSYRLDQMRDFIRLLYSWRVGMGMTSTWSSKAMRVDFGFSLVRFVFGRLVLLLLLLLILWLPPPSSSFSSSLSSGTTIDSSSHSSSSPSLFSSSEIKPDLRGSFEGTTPLNGLLIAEPSGGDWKNMLYPTPMPLRMRTRRCCAAVSGCDCICWGIIVLSLLPPEEVGGLEP
jgi:hypothetical protein